MYCNKYDPDRLFQKFKVVEFPISIVGMTSSLDLDMDIPLNNVYIKTMCDGNLMKYNESREISAPHRAFNISQTSDKIVSITFKPTTECIAKAMKTSRNIDNKFIIDLRFIKVDGSRCCDQETHAEIGRCYISGQYEYCTLNHTPAVVSFGDLFIFESSTKYVRVHNDSKHVYAKLTYEKIPGFQVLPSTFIMQPNSSKRIAITLKPCSLKTADVLKLKVRNSFKSINDINEEHSEENVIDYMINTVANILIRKTRKEPFIESLHNIYEQNPWYTYMGNEIKERDKRHKVALKFLEDSKTTRLIKPKSPRCFGAIKCYPETLITKLVINSKYNFCHRPPELISRFDLFSVTLQPFSIDFGEIGLNSSAKHNLVIKNNTKYKVTIRLFKDSYISYTEDKKSYIKLKMLPMSKLDVILECDASKIGDFHGTFRYSIDDKYFLKHPYILRVENPTIRIQEQILKFGMVTADNYVTSVAVRIFNTYNVPVSFEWEEMLPETPFEVFPTKSIVNKHSCKICELIYICKPTKCKTHEIYLKSGNEGIVTKIIPLEVNVVTRKISIKFAQMAICFKDIALNLETVEKAKLENSSREFVTFYVMEPLLPGFTVIPMSGILRPKMVIEFDIIVKISCVMEFITEILVKVNNKDTVVLPVSGNVVEPKVIIQPKTIYMTRVPSNMITYVPITLQNASTIRAFVEILDTGDDNIFDVYVAHGNEKYRVFNFYLEAGQNKTLFIKVYDYYRREYEMYIPFRINRLFGPPDHNHNSTELQYYINQYERYYDNNPRVKVKSTNKDIAYCKITGVITVAWIEFSEERFVIDYILGDKNSIEFTMTNVSKYYLYVTIITAKLSPWFSLDIFSEEIETIINDNNIKFEFSRGTSVQLTLKFHPKGHGRFVAIAPLFLDRFTSLPYYNLTFIGRRQNPVMTANTNRVIFPPCLVGTELTKEIILTLELVTDLQLFTCSSKEDSNIHVKFKDYEVIQKDDKMFTVVTATIRVCCKTTYARALTLGFHHECGSGCDVETVFSATYCPITLHTLHIVEPLDNPYPYYPLSSQTELYEYLETCSNFLEKWMFQQGFRRELYPVIPDTFHAISPDISGSFGSVKQNKGMNVSYINFIKRIAGPLMKHIRKIMVHGVDDSFKCVKEIHDTYREIICLLKSRGAYLLMLKARYLLSYDQFLIYSENTATKSNADIIMINELRSSPDLFERLNKQSWIDFILQSYKVFMLDSCFFECVCVSSQKRDITKILIDWYNEHISMRHSRLRSQKPVKLITNLKDLRDSIALISVFENYCPFLEDHFSLVLDPDEDPDEESIIIHNACLVIEALNLLKLFFPLTSKDMLSPNFIQMIFLSIHLYVTLPMFKPKETVTFSPPLLRSASRLLSISPVTQESLQYNFSTLFNTHNHFYIEKTQATDNTKKMYITAKYSANLTRKCECLLLLQGFNKTRIFDTYITFKLVGFFSSLMPLKKYKVVGPIYRPIKVDVLVTSPFSVNGLFQVSLTDTEPTMPLDHCETSNKHQFYLRRLNLIDKEICLSAVPKDGPTDQAEYKLFMQLVCLNTQVGNTWVWFRSDIGDFFIKITTQPRWDLAIETMHVKVETWPMDPCSCGEACECYRTALLNIPHRNDLMIKSMRYALLENASNLMMTIFDQLIESSTGREVLLMLLIENGTNICDVKHILRDENSYRITSRTLMPRLESVNLEQHTDAVLALPVTLSPNESLDRYSVTFTSTCGMDIRTYRIIFLPPSSTDGSSTLHV